MKNKIITAVSMATLVAAVPAFGDTVKSQAEVNAEASTSGNISEDAKEAWEEIKDDATEVYEEVKATVIGEQKNGEHATVVIDSRKTANGIIGKPVFNEQAERVAKVHDIILDESGKAVMVVVTDGAFIAVGKKAAFDYGAITRIDVNGDVIMPLTEEMINNAARFSYEADESGENVRVLAANGVSVNAILAGQVLNHQNEAVAEIDNISLKNGSADRLIIGFDKVLGMGGQNAVLNYADATLIRDGDDLDFKLSADKSAQFETYKKTVTN
jgi:sporulation protein YlmC with PRC-barrel domain